MANSLPEALLNRLRQIDNFNADSFLQTHLQADTVTSVRINPAKDSGQFGHESPVPWCESGRYLASRPSFIADPLFHAGCYYVQEASSMFLEQALKQSTDLSKALRVVDLCAAPGGKSTLIASLINERSLLLSNEIIKSRAPILADNLTRWGNINTVVSNNDPRDIGKLDSFFDVMVVDAPCSGSGMFRKDASAISEWSENNVQLCSERQQRILADAYPALKNGGTLIYSTCSYSEEENEQIADWLCDNYRLKPVRLTIDEAWGITETLSPSHGAPGYRFYPHKVKGEGFFIACFIKEEGDDEANFTPFKPSKGNQSEQKIIKSWLRPSEDQWLLPVKDGYSVISREFLEDITFLQSKLYLKKAGVYAGKVIGKDLVPEQELAQSHLLAENVPSLELTLEQAIRYLRKDVMEADYSLRGWALMNYKGYGLGWAKLLPNRINNYYPKELRILKEIL